MDSDEQQIIQGLKDGDNRAYKYLYDRHYVLLCKIALAYLLDAHLAQILVDDTILHLYEKRETLLINVSLRAYLVRSVRNRCVSHLRSEYAKREVNFSEIDNPEDKLFSIAGEDYPLAILLERELESEIHSAIKRLPAECRAVFEKSRYEGKDYEAIARELAISVNTVKYHIKNALSRLNKELGNYLPVIVSGCLVIL
ncbi:MAG: RNA polymerase sigma-70 factor [Tannerellaceae bacterium]|jgi:RNA polymerase sigma-70 factor (ECF subfamily)|nr:RNA polymerase sigma-70 factor [Tannerellaceae bacterium]